MGSVQRINRPKPWLARYRAPDGRQHSKTFHRKIDAEKWLRGEESAADRGAWVDPQGGSILYQEWADRWFAGLVDLRPKTMLGGCSTPGASSELSGCIDQSRATDAGPRLSSNDPRCVWGRHLVGASCGPHAARSAEWEATVGSS